MKKAMVMVVALILLTGIGLPALGEATPPLSSGVVNKSSTIYWGKGEQFPVLATVSAGTKLDVYEYDTVWVLVLYKTYISYQGQFSEHSFYGYLKRADIDCEPPLEGDASARADTGPGKKKGKRPKPNTSPPPAQPTPGSTDTPADTQPPEVTVEPMEEEFDWIIRTNGLQTQQVTVEGIAIACSFSLMAQKAGGTAPSSDPAFNHGMHTPYAATAFYSMKLATSDVLEDTGLASLTGQGGIDISMQAAGATFFIDTGAEDFALVSFTLPMQGTGIFDPSVTGEIGSGRVNADAGTTSMSGGSSISVQLRKSGGGYKFVLVGLKPGGGNLEYPAVLEKTFADPDRFDKEAAKADMERKKAETEARRKKAEAERDKMLEEGLKESQERLKKAEEASKAMDDAIPDDEKLAPVSHDIPDDEKLAPVTNEQEPQTPLVPPSTDENAPPFPDSGGELERRETKCA